MLQAKVPLQLMLLPAVVRVLVSIDRDRPALAEELGGIPLSPVIDP